MMTVLVGTKGSHGRDGPGPLIRKSDKRSKQTGGSPAAIGEQSRPRSSRGPMDLFKGVWQNRSRMHSDDVGRLSTRIGGTELSRVVPWSLLRYKRTTFSTPTSSNTLKEGMLPQFCATCLRRGLG